MFNAWIMFLFFIMGSCWVYVVIDYREGRDALIQRLEKQYRMERFIECKKLMGGEL